MTRTMTPTDRRREAQRRAYLVLWGLLEGRLDGQSLAWVRRIPELAEHLPPLDDADVLDELDAAHHRLFELDLAPYAGVYHHPEGLAGGEVAQDVMDLLGDSSFFVEPLGDRTTDHLFMLLALIGHEVEALHVAQLARRRSKRASDDLERRRAHLRASLDRHLLSWLPDFVAGALRAADDDATRFWGTVLELTLGTLADQRRSLGGDPWLPEDAELGAGIDTEGPLPKVLAGLSVPLRAGTFLSRHDITDVARRLELPTGFGRRADQLEALGESALHLGDPSQLVAAIDATLDRCASTREALAVEHQIEAYLGPWNRRLDATRAALAALR